MELVADCEPPLGAIEMSTVRVPEQSLASEAFMIPVWIDGQSRRPRKMEAIGKSANNLLVVSHGAIALKYSN